MDGKECASCHRYLTPTSQHFYVRADTGGYRSHCNLCSRQRRDNEKVKAAKRRHYHRTKKTRTRRECDRQYDKRRYERNKFLHNIKSYVRKSLKHGKGGNSLHDALGYSIAELRDHMERQFSPRMSWSNYGTYWCIDHIVPICSFSFSSHTDDDFKACWALTNLRPMVVTENAKKSGMRSHLL
jgi:hypothetical protein